MKTAVLWTLALSLAACAPTASSNVVDLGYVRYRGVRDNSSNVISWNGIRFAESPEGKLRWRAPVPVNEKVPNHSKGEIQDASQPAPACPQGIPTWFTISGFSGPYLPASEDCLFLNVHAPARRGKQLLPVMVVIHSGGYTIGNALTLSGSLVVSQSNGGVISVEIQYRLGGFGFLAGKAINADGTANAGLLDQRAALDWVQRHIKAFGGDPRKVTILGGSAGGGSVTAQLQLYGGVPKPPFRAAVADFPWWQTFHNDTFYNTQYSQLLKATKCHDLNCLRGLKSNDLYAAINQTYITAYKSHSYGFGDFYYGPAIDGKTMIEFPSQAFSSGNFAKVPMIIDRDAFEGLIFTNGSLSSPQEAQSDLQQLWPAANANFFRDLERAYPLDAFRGQYFSSPPVSEINPSTTAIGAQLAAILPRFTNNYGQNPAFWRRQQVFGDAFVGCGTQTVAEALVKYNVPIWKYVFNTGLYIHGASEFAFFTDQFSQLPSDREQLRAYVLAFLEHLDPNAEATDTYGATKRPFWPQYGRKSTILNFNSSAIAVGNDPDNSGRCAFVRHYSDIIRN